MHEIATLLSCYQCRYSEQAMMDMEVDDGPPEKETQLIQQYTQDEGKGFIKLLSAVCTLVP